MHTYKTKCKYSYLLFYISQYLYTVQYIIMYHIFPTYSMYPGKPTNLSIRNPLKGSGNTSRFSAFTRTDLNFTSKAQKTCGKESRGISFLLKIKNILQFSHRAVQHFEIIIFSSFALIPLLSYSPRFATVGPTCYLASKDGLPYSAEL